MKKVKFFEIDGNPGVYAKVEDFIIGYDNDITYKIPKDLAEKIWSNPIKEMAVDLEDGDKIEEIEERFDIDIEDFELRGVQYNLSEDVAPHYYWQAGMPEAELHETEQDFFASYPDEDILLGDDGNGYRGYEPYWVGNMASSFELEFIKEGKCLDEHWGVCLQWEEFYRNDDGKTIKAIVSNDNRQDSKNYYTFED